MGYQAFNIKQLYLTLQRYTLQTQSQCMCCEYQTGQYRAALPHPTKLHTTAHSQCMPGSFLSQAAVHIT